MIKTLLAALLLSTLLLASCGGQNQNDSNNSTPKANDGTEHHVIMENYSFNPPKLTIKTGDTVTWINNDSVKHTVTSWYEWGDEDDVWNTSIGQEWSSGDIEPGEQYTRQFNQAGEYQYLSLPLYFILLNLHRLDPGMQGRIYVIHK